MIHVCHINDRPAKYDERHIYIGRAMPRRGLRGSALGNPYRLQRESERAHVLELYKSWLLGIGWQSAEDRELNRLVELARTGDVWIYCWCKTKAAPHTPCHGDVIKEEIESRL